MSIVQQLQALRDGLRTSDRLPVVFLGHGSPMNAIEDNDYARSWAALGHALPRPQAILVVSAHWMTQGSTLVDISRMPRTIHDFYGFPDELFAQQYPAPGTPEMAQEVVSLLASHHAEGDDSWGLDHGAWSVLKFLYPEADVPVFQLSIDMSKDLVHHREIGEALKELRERGVLILGSGNVVHNLRTMRRGGLPYDWAEEFDAVFADRLTAGDHAALTDRAALGTLFAMAHPSPDHYLPALTVAGASDPKDRLMFMNTSIDIGSVSMRSFIYY
ncbi:4,5-DOPA dioxygenase extradiol [Celeribacter indicus]|uniref:Extradiol ring-cleavage dioxygenase III subunit B n=1 Tax=Celeribacter indicus TaxID=1208324 RepID=A0A0B5DYE9_9RHOB|nr:4,5-DOPA dioxygenase extradiol [Celeribacter indicus]AJE45222.1 extradiol ring-cleavage dioxygenase III subunit B [Celeribacter indicus]SDX45635.1 4,5-DOPA dioxygenase extradiol [Celeribacter indicus]